MSHFSQNDALAMDAADALRQYRDRFYVQPAQVYLDGNSLGLLSKDAEAAVIQALYDWKHAAIHGWTQASEPWFTLPENLGALSAPLVGALNHEVVVTGTTTINLHTLLATFYRPAGNRSKILCDAENFPSDLYAIQSHLALHGRPQTDLLMIQAGVDGWVHEDDVIEQMTDDVQIVLLPSVWYKSGQLADMARLTTAAHKRGILIGFDCAHSIGAIAHHLHDWGVDFAVWCNYKYLNGGPGATAGLYVHERHHHLNPGLAGWFSSNKETQFQMAFPMEPAHTAAQWQISTPPILSTVAVAASLRMFAEVGIEAIREKSLKQTSFLRTLLEERIIHEGLGGEILTPVDDERRGGHIAFCHPHAVQVGKALREQGVTPDFRPPNILRLAPIPLYTSYLDIWRGVEILRSILVERRYEAFSAQSDVVS